MFDTLQDRLSAAFRNLRGKTRLSEAEIEATLREAGVATPLIHEWALYDLADLENSRWMHSTGQSGIVFSPWYRSYAERWAAVRYMPMRMDARAEAGTLKLLPR